MALAQPDYFRNLTLLVTQHKDKLGSTNVMLDLATKLGFPNVPLMFTAVINIKDEKKQAEFQKAFTEKFDEVSKIIEAHTPTTTVEPPAPAAPAPAKATKASKKAEAPPATPAEPPAAEPKEETPAPKPVSAPMEALHHHTTGAVERGEKQPIVEVPPTPPPAAVVNGAVKDRALKPVTMPTAFGAVQPLVEYIASEVEKRIQIPAPTVTNVNPMSREEIEKIVNECIDKRLEQHHQKIVAAIAQLLGSK